MKRLVVGITAAVVLAAAAQTASAQARTIRSEMQTEAGVVEAIDAASRTVTIKKADGTFVSVIAGPEIKRFAEVKVGDKVNARYYENVIIRLKRPGEPDVDNAAKNDNGHRAGHARRHEGQAADDSPSTITAIDLKASTISFNGPNGWKYTSKVQDVEALAKVKVGDKIDIVWTEAMMVSLEPAQ